MKTVRRRLWVVAVAAALICLSVSLGTWVIKRQGEVETVGWSPLFESRVERALTPLKTTEVTAQPAPPDTQQPGCTKDCEPPPDTQQVDCTSDCEPPPDTKDDCEPGETVAGRTCETVDLTCGCDSWDEPCDLDTFAIAAPCPVPTQDATCYDNDPDCAETADDTCNNETCDWTCATCQGTETCDHTCYDYYCDTLVGAATCDGTTCDTCDEGHPDCKETADDTCEGKDTCDGETCDAAVETCDGTCDGKTCDAFVGPHDILPTLLAFTGPSTPQPLGGQNLWDWVRSIDLGGVKTFKEASRSRIRISQKWIEWFLRHLSNKTFFGKL